MPQQRSNKSQTPINSDPFNLIPDLATLSDTLGTIVVVADRTEGDSVATARAAAGWPVSDSRPLYVWNLSSNALEVKNTAGWKGGVKPFGHAGKINGFTGSATPVPISSQVLRGGMTFSSADNALVIPVAGYYKLAGRVYSSGGGTGLAFANVLVNGSSVGAGVQWTKTQVDEYMHMNVTRLLAAGDKVSLGSATPASLYGSDGYNGCWIEAEFADQW